MTHEPNEVEVTAFDTFCFCSTPDLDDKNVRKNCDTQWKERKDEPHKRHASQR